MDEYVGLLRGHSESHYTFVFREFFYHSTYYHSTIISSRSPLVCTPPRC